MHLKAAKLLFGLVVVVWSLFLMFKILTHIRATELMWFLYWGYIPLIVVLGILQALVEDS